MSNVSDIYRGNAVIIDEFQNGCRLFIWPHFGFISMSRGFFAPIGAMLGFTHCLVNSFVEKVFVVCYFFSRLLMP